MKKPISQYLNTLISIVFLFLSIPVFAFAQVISGNTPGEFINSFYNFTLLAGGVLAFGAVVYGGIIYTFAAGNPSKQSEGKDWVTSALLGLLLLAGASLILRTINPKLTDLTLPGLPGISGGTGISSGGVTTAGCPTCQQLNQAGFVCKNSSSCSADPRMIQALQCLVQRSGEALRITEAYPPGGQHQSACHYNGCCVDATLSSASSCNEVQTVINAASACNASVLNEYLGCQGTATGFRTGDHLHIRGC